MTTTDGFRNRTLAQRELVSWKNAPRLLRRPVPEHALLVRPIQHQPTQVTANAIRVVPPELWRFPGTMEQWVERFDSSNGNSRVAKLQRATAFPALLPAALPLLKPPMRTRPGQPEADAGFTQSLPMTSQASSQTLFHLYKAQRLTAFPALLPAASTLTQPTMFTRPVQPEAEAGFIHQAQRPVDLSYVLQSPITVAKPEQRQEASGLFPPPIGFPSVPTTSQVPGIDVNRLTDQVYQALERKIRLEKQRRGHR